MPYTVCIWELMNRHRHVRGARLRPFRLALRAPSAARPLPRRCLTGRAEELRASPCAPVPGLRSDKARSLARASERKTVLSRLSLPS